MQPVIVQNYAELLEAAKNFDRDVRITPQLQRLATYNRAWYYIPDLDVVANCMFLAYAGMDAASYLADANQDALDGREAGRALDTWFDELDRYSPEHAFVRSRVADLLRGFGKSINAAARFYAPRGWRCPPSRPVHLGDVHLRSTIPAAIFRGSACYIADCPLLGIVTQGATLDETLANLREAFELRVQGEDPEQLGMAPGAVLLVQIEAGRWAA